MGGGCTASLLLWFIWHACVAWHACALRIGVIHYRPSSMPIKAFEVGFVSAMKLLETDSSIEVEWINCDNFNGKHPEDLHLARRHYQRCLEIDPSGVHTPITANCFLVH